MAGRFRFRKASGGWRLIRAILLALVIVILIPYLLVPLYRVVDPVSTLMVWRWATGARSGRVRCPGASARWSPWVAP